MSTFGVSAVASKRAALLLLAVLGAMLFVTPVSAAPHRQKRVSDQRLAELETFMALNKLKGQLVTVPVGYGKVDPALLGRRRRSEDDTADAIVALNADENEEIEPEEIEAYAAGRNGRLSEVLQKVYRLAEVLAAMETRPVQRPVWARLAQ